MAIHPSGGAFAPLAPGNDKVHRVGNLFSIRPFIDFVSVEWRKTADILHWTPRTRLKLHHNGASVNLWGSPQIRSLSNCLLKFRYDSGCTVEILGRQRSTMLLQGRLCNRRLIEAATYLALFQLLDRRY